MAHNCPECGALCYCGGDIDDCLLDLPEDVAKCGHWKECEDQDDEVECGEEEYDPTQHNVLEETGKPAAKPSTFWPDLWQALDELGL